MLNDKNIKDLFNNSSLEDESWLEPSDSVFNGIEQAIYNDEKEKKPFIFWLIGIGILICSIGIIIWSLNSKDPIQTVSTKSQNDHSYNEPSTPESNNEILLSQSAYNTDTNNINNSDSYLKENQNILKEDFKIVSQNSITQVSKNNQYSDINTSSSHSGLSTIQSTTLLTDPTINDIDNTNILSDIRTDNTLISDAEDNIRSQNLISISTITPGALEYQRSDILIKKLASASTLTVQPSSFESSTFFNIGLGTSIWDYNLNDNYSSALSPADFSHTTGTSSVLQIGIEKRSSQLISFRANISYEEVSFQSGHNSNITYRNAEENSDFENNFALAMATPLGGVNTNIAVRRNQDNTLEENTFTINLHNQHNYKNVDLSFSLLQHLLDKKSINISTEVGAGINRMFALNNNLSAVDISDTSYSIASIDESSTQDNLNNTRAHMILGINAGATISTQVDLNFAYLYKSDFSPIFSSGDFSTTLIRHQFVVSAKTRF